MRIGLFRFGGFLGRVVAIRHAERAENFLWVVVPALHYAAGEIGVIGMTRSSQIYTQVPAATAVEEREASRPKHLPTITTAGGLAAPEVPSTLDATGIDPEVLGDLALKLANTVPRLTSDWASDQLRLPLQLIEQIFWRLRDDQFLEILSQTGPLTYRYAITQRGREYARRLLEISGYVGPAPVSLDAYEAMLEWQVAQLPPPTMEKVKSALSPLMLPPNALEVSSLAAASGRSLFLFGAPGNGKTTLGRLLHNALAGELWIPHCIAIESNIIRIYDRHLHELSSSATELEKVDQRWLRVKRPFVVAGGEMTMAELDLAYSPSLRVYEAPPHVKANGGTFLLDDFGRQHLNPSDLLNRWIIPLEQQIDHLTLATGQKIRIPFKLMLIVATNLPGRAVADPAFLRRMGYRLHLDKPDAKRFSEIWRRYAKWAGLRVDEKMIEEVLDRYAREGRELRASEPRDLMERVRDICALRQRAFALEDDLLDLAWRGYFGATE
jgi:hypothetical protein